MRNMKQNVDEMSWWSTLIVYAKDLEIQCDSIESGHIMITSNEHEDEEWRNWRDLQQSGSNLQSATLGNLVFLFSPHCTRLEPDCQRSAEIYHVMHPFSDNQPISSWWFMESRPVSILSILCTYFDIYWRICFNYCIYVLLLYICSYCWLHLIGLESQKSHGKWHFTLKI